MRDARRKNITECQCEKIGPVDCFGQNWGSSESFIWITQEVRKWTFCIIFNSASLETFRRWRKNPLCSELLENSRIGLDKQFRACVASGIWEWFICRVDQKKFGSSLVDKWAFSVDGDKSKIYHLWWWLMLQLPCANICVVCICIKAVLVCRRRSIRDLQILWERKNSLDWRGHSVLSFSCGWWCFVRWVFWNKGVKISCDCFALQSLKNSQLCSSQFVHHESMMMPEWATSWAQVSCFCESISHRKWNSIWVQRSGGAE